MNQIDAIRLSRRQAYRDSYVRFLQAKREFPDLNHAGHEPLADIQAMEAQRIRTEVERDFHRSLGIT